MPFPSPPDDMSHRILCFILLLQAPFTALAAEATPEQKEFFEKTVRPLLAENCFGCHGEKQQKGDLRLDRKQFIFADGPVGQPVIPTNLADSRLWQVIQYDESDTQMPPKAKLPTEKIAVIEKWISSGAYWPEEAVATESEEHSGIPKTADGNIDFIAAQKQHWAYQPLQEPRVPESDPSQNLTAPIDRIVAAKLAANGLALSPPADKQTLIRRLSFDLRGLPAEFSAVQEFEKNDSARAFEDLVDRYLNDPAYGQRWGRYWLDIARYADTKGYVFTQNRFYPYSYTYRDYVIDAFNKDLPYSTFLMEQLAADQLGYAENDPRLAALGFLTIGPRFLNSEPDIIDDRIDVVTRGLMGMTVACARCHDHKYDPVPTADYYSLYGVFNSCYEPELPPLRGELDTNAPGYDEFAAELHKREQAAQDYIIHTHNELLAKARNELDDYFPAAMKALKILPEDLELAPKHGNPRVKLIERWQTTIQQRLQAADPVLLPGTKYMELLRDGVTPEKTEALLAELDANSNVPDGIVSELRNTPPQSALDVVNAYVRVLSAVRDEWEQFKQAHPEAEHFEDSGKEAIRSMLYGPNSVSDVAAGEYSPLFERDNRDAYRNLQKQIDEWHVTSPNAPPRSMVLLDKETLVEPVIFERGNVGRRGDQVPRRGPRILDPSPNNVFSESSGRRKLAEMIVSADNPLTARVIANRVWMYHFGRPLVSTPGDFGMQIPAPQQQALLDYLAWSLIHNHTWSLKGLHREILLTKTWQQQSIDRPEARKIDPENQFYWKQNRQRLDFEAMRDSMLSVAGRLDLSLGGRPVNIEQAPFSNRRSVYALIDRNNPSGLLRTFDFPTPNSSSPNRSETSVPQQALFGMNSPFAKEVSESLAKRVRESGPEDQSAQRLIETVFSRTAEASEIQLLNGYLADHSLEQLAQGVLYSNEFFFID